MESTEREFMIPIDEYLIKFDKHLSYSERTIFSAKFGDGKTYFLNKFKEKYKEKYEFITIYPVNYQIVDNKDIFELIKRDILIQMVANRMIEDSYEIDNSVLVQYYTSSKVGSLFFDLLQIIPTIGISEEMATTFIAGAKAISFFKKQYDDFIRYKNNIDKKTDPNIVEIFLEKFDHQSGCIYEFDAITKVITENIKFHKERTNKNIVFIIEDLDRIDPSHIFRILNIFSAHIDRNNYSLHEIMDTKIGNKFCFDNIVTVCHYDNTQKIFHHFYGQDTCFEGYINKFISYSKFSYSINEIAKKYLIKFIEHECKIKIQDYPSILEKIKSISIRDIKKSLMNIEDQIISSQIYDINNFYHTSTISPLSKLLVISKRFSISNDELFYNIITNKKNENNLDVFATYLCLYEPFLSCQCAKISNLYIGIRRMTRENSEICTADVYQSSSGIMLKKGINEIIEDIIKSIENYIV